MMISPIETERVDIRVNRRFLVGGFTADVKQRLESNIFFRAESDRQSRWVSDLPSCTMRGVALVHHSGAGAWVA